MTATCCVSPSSGSHSVSQGEFNYVNFNDAIGWTSPNWFDTVPITTTVPLPQQKIHGWHFTPSDQYGNGIWNSDIDWPGRYNTPIDSFKVYMNCPHCNKNVEQKPDWLCSNCKQFMFVVRTINYEMSREGILKSIEAIIPMPAEPKKQERPKSKDGHAGDGSRWDEL